MPNKPKAKKKKKLSYETRCRRLKEYRANLPDEKKQKIKEYNRMRSLKARANETPHEREKRLQRCRESARRRRTKRKSQTDREMRKLGLLARKNNNVQQDSGKLDSKNPLQNLNLKIGNQMGYSSSNLLPAFLKNPKLFQAKYRKDGHLPNELQFPYKPIPMQMSAMNLPPMNMNDSYDDMATVCPIECNVDISEPVPKTVTKNPPNLLAGTKLDTFVKNIGSNVVLEKKPVSRGPPEDPRLQNGGTCDWNGFASVCPIECNVDIKEIPETIQPSKERSREAIKRNSLLDNLKQMGTHVIIKKKADNRDKNIALRHGLSNVDICRVLPVECNVDIKPVMPRLKSSEITIVKQNGNTNIRKLGSQIMMQKVQKPVQEKRYEPASENYEDYDMSCPIECNVDISESS